MRLSARFRDAMAMAAELHAGQTRKGTDIPYVAHLLGVTALVLEDGGDEDEAVAALLHDAAEDQGGAPTLARIRAAFGDRVAGIVEELSDSMDGTPEARAPWIARKRAYLGRVAHHSASARRVSLADKLHNVTAIVRDLRVHGPAVWDRFNGGHDGTLWYYRALAAAYAGAGPLADDFARAVAEMEEFA